MGYRVRPLTAAMAVAFSTAVGQHAQAQTTLNEVVVTAGRIPEASSPRQIGDAEIAAKHAVTRDTAALLQDVPGVSLYGAGGISSLPAIHGLADDRLRITVDGMDFIASCPNHMNPPLSYVDPTDVRKIKVYAGVTPVSVGGDSIGGSIVAETKAPEFAAPGQGVLTKGEIGAFARGNNKALGGNVAATVASENLSITYSGAYAQADNYKAGGNFKTFTATGRPGHTLGLDEVGSTAYESKTHVLGLALKSGDHLVEARIGFQDVPKQLYPNQRMDMLDNEQKRFSLRYLGQYAWGTLDARVYHERVEHFMNFGDDKQFQYGTAPGMPMYTRGRTTGANLTADIDLGERDLLRVGGLWQGYRLNDWWPPSGTGMMAPYDFLNIDDGKRQRAAVFGEWEKHWNPRWLTQIGVRHEHVTTSAGPVHGYNLPGYPTGGASMMDMMNQTRDAANFNRDADRRRADNNWDLTALAHYKIDATREIEFGLSRKVRSPSLYERYTWSTAAMMAIMNNFAGDGNGYVGNANLKPEKAHTLSATLDLHAADRRFELKATPYYTLVTDYIDAVRCGSAGMGGCPAPAANPNTVKNQFVRLQYANQSARLYGIDLSGRMPLADTAVGDFGLKGLLNYTKGENRDTGDALYNIMPLNLKLALTHQSGGWNNAVEFVAARGKHDTSAVRNEIETAGYSLTHLRSSYTWKNARFDIGVENLFDKFYYLPTGGAYTGQGATMGINSIPWGIAVPGMGRSLYAGFNLKF